MGCVGGHQGQAHAYSVGLAKEWLSFAFLDSRRSCSLVLKATGDTAPLANCRIASRQFDRARRPTPQQVVPIGAKLHHVSMQCAHGARGGTPVTNIQRGRDRRRTAPSRTGHGCLRGTAAVPEAQPPSFSAHHPPPRIAADRSPGRHDDLRNGAPRRVSTSLQPDATLRGMGFGRGGSLDRGTQTNPSCQRRQTRCPPTKNPPCSSGFGPGLKPAETSPNQSFEFHGS